MLLAKVAEKYAIVEGVDVAAAYLHGELRTSDIMEPSTDSSGIPCKPNHVALVIKSMHGHRKTENI